MLTPDHLPSPASALRPRLRLLAWRPLRQASLRGFATIEISPPGLVVHDVTVHRSGEACFALWPGKPQVSPEDRVLRDDRGRRKYSAIIEVPDREVRERLSNAIIAAVRQRDPEALS